MIKRFYLRILRAFLAALVPLTLIACSTTPTGRSQLAFMPKGQMEQLGDQSFAQMQKQQKLSKDQALNARIACIARRIIENMPKDNKYAEWDVKVFEDEAINAFALPGKNIGVYTGLIKAAESDDQIASVIGHEVGHVLADHGNERVSQNLVVQGGLLAASVAMGGSNEPKDQLIMASLGLASQVGILLPFSRSHESEADQIGMDLMAKAGFDPQGAIDFWEVMGKKSGSQPPEILSTHPAHKSRIDNLKRHLPGASEFYRQNRGKFTPCS